jgi:type IV pilus assembly protein PilM
VTHFYVLRNNQFLFSRDQAFGGNQLTHDVQRAFNLTPDEAESAKKSQGLPENYDTDVLQPFMETLALEVTRALQFFFTSTVVQPGRPDRAGRRLRAPAGNRRARREARRRDDRHRQPVRQHGDVRPHPAAAARAGRPLLMIACGLALRSFE